LRDYISIYDIARAFEDGATVPIYYEGRLAKLELSEAERPTIDPDFEEVTEGGEVERKEGLKSNWAQPPVFGKPHEGGSRDHAREPRDEEELAGDVGGDVAPAFRRREADPDAEGWKTQRADAKA
jgi:hypothetical protein